MWRNYFLQIQNKYNMRLSISEPLVIRFDGKDVTKDNTINLFDIYNGSFADSIEKTVKFFTAKYHAFSIFGSDEISFIFPDPMSIISDLDVEKSNRSNKIISLFSQYLFNYFNSLYKGRIIFWDVKAFSIHKEKLSSYIKYRSGSLKNVVVTYFLKKKRVIIGDKPLKQLLNEAQEFDDYKMLEKVQNGRLYYDGSEIDIIDYLENGKITNLKKEVFTDDYIDLSSF